MYLDQIGSKRANNIITTLQAISIQNDAKFNEMSFPMKQLIKSFKSFKSLGHVILNKSKI